jgi:nicotinate-nucleotide adenylyltransferase
MPAIVKCIVAERERIGVLGGSFDPIHVAHLVAAVVARDEIGLDRVLMVVANDPWQKSSTRQIGNAEVRFRAVEAAVAPMEGVEASRLELDRGGPSRTVDTLGELETQFPGAELHLIVGADTAAGLETWDRWQEVRSRCHLVVMNRPGSPSMKLVGWDVRNVTMPSLDVSSTWLRERLGAGRPVGPLVPEQALDIYRAAGLYL